MKKILACLILSVLLSGCNVSPLSPSNRPNIKNNGEMGDIKSNQQGIMAEMLNLKNRMDVMAQEIENIQNGFINHNNKNSGIQIFQGDGGLIAGMSCMALLALVAINYKLKSDKYKKTAEIFGERIRSMNRPEVEEEVLVGALKNRVDIEAFKILRGNQTS